MPKAEVAASPATLRAGLPDPLSGSLKTAAPAPKAVHHIRRHNFLLKGALELGERRHATSRCHHACAGGQF